MKQNQNIHIVGKTVVLVPYKLFHVDKYHEWMQNDELREATASELLTLEQEYEMQKCWMVDEDKCTFIILDKSIMDDTNNEIDAMVGDVNLFLSASDSIPESSLQDTMIAEVSIMIAEKSARRHGKAFEALLLMIKYGIDFLNIKMFTAKIGSNNTVSIKLFQKIGFVKISECEVFSEVTMMRTVDADWRFQLKQLTEESIVKDIKTSQK